jgi:hypothetical protein
MKSEMGSERDSEKGRTLLGQDSSSVAGAAFKKPSRRGFLAGVGVAGVAGAAALAAGRGAAPAAAEAAGEAPAAGTLAGRGYHETDHVRRYYDTAKV